MPEAVTVAVGIIQDPQGRVLVSRRATDAHQGGLWEFPGGKVEPGEAIEMALAREFREELGLEVLASEALMRIEHDYGDKQVCLDVRRVTQWQGEACGLEGQPLAWQLPEDLRDWAFPAANAPILNRLIAG
jgi:8-oxo-dGTP diphosphatase